MPLNYKELNTVLADENLRQLAVLAAWCQELQEQAHTKQSQNSFAPAPALPAPTPTLSTATMPGGPVINVNFPAEMFQMFHNPSAAAVPWAPLTQIQSVSLSAAMLLTPSQLQSLGPRLSLDDFTTLYDISQNLQHKLIENGYIASHSLCFATIQDLEAIGVLHGEIVQLKDAVSHWCNAWIFCMWPGNPIVLYHCNM